MKNSEAKSASSVFETIGPEGKTHLEVLPDLVFILTKGGIFLDCHAPDLLALLAPPEQFLGSTQTFE